MRTVTSVFPEDFASYPHGFKIVTPGPPSFSIVPIPAPAGEPEESPPQPAEEPEPVKRLDFRFPGHVLYWIGDRVEGICDLSETEWFMAKTVEEAGEEGAEYSALMLAVPEWDVEETTDRAVSDAYGKAGNKLNAAGIPRYYSTRKDEKGGIKQHVVKKDGCKPKKDK